MLVLETEPLKLRKMTTDDVDNLLLIVSDPVAMQYYPSTMDRDEAIAWIRRTQMNYERRGLGFWIVERKADGTFLGQCGLIPQELEGVVETEVAYLFARASWGQGFATEAAMACRDWGFTHLDVPRLVSIISIYNAPSMRVAERNGMTPVADVVKPGGIPHYVYAISRRQWQERKIGVALKQAFRMEFPALFQHGASRCCAWHRRAGRRHGP